MRRPQPQNDLRSLSKHGAKTELQQNESHMCDERSASSLKNKAPDCKHYSYTSISGKMDFFRELRELRGNQGREEEEEGVISVEPIAMIVPSALPETITPESSASSNARDNGGDHHTSPSSSSSSRETPNREEETGNVVGDEPSLPVVGEWENRVITGRLSNLRKAPKELPSDFKFRVVLHHEVADNAPSISRMKGLHGVTGGLDTSVPDAQQHKVHHRLYAVVCEVGGTDEGDSVQVAILVSTVPKLQSGEVEEAVHFRSRHAHRKNKQRPHYSAILMARAKCISFLKGNVKEPRAPKVARQAAPLRDRHDLTSGRPQRCSLAARHIVDQAWRPGRGPSIELKLRLLVHAGMHALPTVAVRSSNAPSATVRAAAEPAPASTSVSAPRIAYPEGFSYVKMDCQPTMVQGMQSFVPLVDRQRARTFVQQHGGQVAMVKLMDAFSYAVALFESEQGARSQNSKLSANCKQLAAEKASLVDNVNRLQGLEMATRAASAESRAEELSSRNNELREELERARAEKESRIQVAKDEAARVKEQAKKAKAKRDHALNELSSLRRQVTQAAQNLNEAEEALNRVKASNGRFVGIARAQGAEWLVGSAAFQDAVAVASANMTTEIYNEIRGKVLQHRPDFPIRELVFFDGEDLDEQGKSLAPLADTTVRLRWELNEEGEPLSTHPSSQPVVVRARSPVSAPACEPTSQPSLARSSPPAANASMPVDLTDD
ncbi:hypothetical protein SLEP1_g44428 [Rubroshorea leprosula]|uniref:Uncharacterized protein n=1 Tax=Rubroshorea leprosula TaxID=152421 RepID=A0AAV5LH98_9ROSI|nr:hypothetical protein SLEP1_g44428 [Rubroshorea leprosula]